MPKLETDARYDVRVQRYLKQREETYNAALKKYTDNLEDSAAEAVNCTVRMANPYETRNGNR